MRDDNTRLRPGQGGSLIPADKDRKDDPSEGPTYDYSDVYKPLDDRLTSWVGVVLFFIFVAALAAWDFITRNR